MFATSTAHHAKLARQAGTGGREAAACSPSTHLSRAAGTMTAEPPRSPVTEAAWSLEVRWIFPGPLEAAVARWFGRFPAAAESREDAYLVDPQLRGLSVKVRGGGALEVKVYRGSRGILQVPGRARGRLQAWQKWSFPCGPLGQDSADLAGWQPAARGGGSAGSHGSAGRPRRVPRCRAASRGARWNSPRSAPAARTGGPWASRRPAPPTCSTVNCRLPPRSCSPSPCPQAWSPARITPGPTRSGSAGRRAPKTTPTPEDRPWAGLASPLRPAAA